MATALERKQSGCYYMFNGVDIYCWWWWGSNDYI